MRDIDFAYLAGYIDGDGCFYIDTVKAKTGEPRLHYRTILKFATVDKEMIEWISDFLGISFWKKVETRQQLATNRRDVYEANLTGESLDKLLPNIFPYLRIKKRHCEIMIKMRSTYTKPNNGVVCPKPTKEIYDFRHKCYLELTSINTHKKLIHPSALSPSTLR